MHMHLHACVLTTSVQVFMSSGAGAPGGSALPCAGGALRFLNYQAVSSALWQHIFLLWPPEVPTMLQSIVVLGCGVLLLSCIPGVPPFLVRTYTHISYKNPSPREWRWVLMQNIGIWVSDITGCQRHARRSWRTCASVPTRGSRPPYSGICHLMGLALSSWQSFLVLEYLKLWDSVQGTRQHLLSLDHAGSLCLVWMVRQSIQETISSVCAGLTMWKVFLKGLPNQKFLLQLGQVITEMPPLFPLWGGGVQRKLRSK